ncbi:MAG TPA: hypothetical protein VFE58_08800 [Tepidisphaeraceae bacterium]|jgi:hypothetical protein|nr:hypothetical protein [Tepidisphaeraceae bacterium]
MTAKYAFSLTGDVQDYQGSYSTRRDARAAALEALKDLSNPPTTVFVARVVPADPQTKGHARMILREMSRKAEVFGLSNYLVGLKVDEVGSLDKELSATIGKWLIQNHLEPKSFRVEAISEYPLPTVPQVKSGPTDEVQDLGETRTVNDL